MVKVKNTKENLAKCVCGKCPSYNECMKKSKEMLFCARGKSSCKYDKKGCICGGCPVSIDSKLTGGYYC